METEPRPAPRPEPLTARSLGMLNIVFGILLLLGVGYEVGVVLALPAFGRLMEWAESMQQQQLDEARQAEQERFDRLLEEAETDEEREAIRARRTLAEMNAFRPPSMMPFSFDFMDSPRLRAGALAKGGVMLVLNGMLIASGIGLWKLRRWGRTLARLTALLMVPAIVGFGIASLLISPEIAERWSAGMAEMLLQGRPPDEAPEVAEVMGRYEEGMNTLFASSTAATSFLVLLYPAMVLVVASRPGVRVAVARPSAS